MTTANRGCWLLGTTTVDGDDAGEITRAAGGNALHHGVVTTVAGILLRQVREAA